jgi:hypothetical protein
MLEAEEDAKTGLGLKMGVAALRGWRVVKLTIGMGTVTGVLTEFSCENGIGVKSLWGQGLHNVRARFLWIQW